ncbi:nuclear transport factor 2 family protein [Rhodococcus sp. T2V]|uniref:nuclear transport factor 2 family protein n=1 Tax=Rhodococcus sp. T2V TaxID=3034164 RepID=UPI0023E09D5D|nr:nuclear transport factor 2 family protein [Rhodococcus sp. T2V]MDF3309662.1 nuclear transport factor 2 family protein [Rhodococcus sp. T2V]
MTLTFRPTTLEHLLAMEEIRLLVVAYGNRVDGGKGDIADLFTDDGVWDSSDNGYPRLEGRDMIAEFFGDYTTRRQRGHRLSHLPANPLITYLDADTAHSVSGFIGQANFSGRDDLVVDSGRYHDEFARTPDGWRFRSRRLEHVLPTRLIDLDAAAEQPRSRSWS